MFYLSWFGLKLYLLPVPVFGVHLRGQDSLQGFFLPSDATLAIYFCKYCLPYWRAGLAYPQNCGISQRRGNDMPGFLVSTFAHNMVCRNLLPGDADHITPLFSMGDYRTNLFYYCTFSSHLCPYNGDTSKIERVKGGFTNRYIISPSGGSIPLYGNPDETLLSNTAPDPLSVHPTKTQDLVFNFFLCLLHPCDWSVHFRSEPILV